MMLHDFLDALFLEKDGISQEGSVLTGSATLRGGVRTEVIGIHGGAALGIDEALQLSEYVLRALEKGGQIPILVLIDSSSQRMSKRDELLGLNEALAHLAKCLIWADMRGHPTCSVLYGHTAAGAFIATALATRELVALPEANPEVMDLPSMSRVTKLPLEVLLEKAKSTPVFAPGIDNLFKTGAVLAVCDLAALAAKIARILTEAARVGAPRERLSVPDVRDRLGLDRGARPKAAEIAQRVYDLVTRA